MSKQNKPFEHFGEFYENTVQPLIERTQPLSDLMDVQLDHQ